eukprot:4861294-Lingulodinium_polyedra.AAC.1
MPLSCSALRRSRSRSLASVGKCTARLGAAAGYVTESNWCWSATERRGAPSCCWCKTESGVC